MITREVFSSTQLCGVVTKLLLLGSAGRIRTCAASEEDWVVSRSGEIPFVMREAEPNSRSSSDLSM